MMRHIQKSVLVDAAKLASVFFSNSFRVRSPDGCDQALSVEMQHLANY